jgi:trehalose/maltose hydrolase-like predicted phosphorylase
MVTTSAHRGLAAGVGHVERAYGYVGQMALMGMRDLEQNTRGSVHIASLAAAAIALVGGLGGMRDHEGRLVALCLPSRFDRLEFSLWQGVGCESRSASRKPPTRSATAMAPLPACSTTACRSP